MIIVRTPFRATLGGGSTDYPSFFSKYGAILTGFAFNCHTYISVRETPPIHEYKTLVHYSKTERVNSNDEIQHNGVRGCLQYLDIKTGVEISTMADLPARTGIGSSSAFCVGLLNALYKLKGKKRARLDLARDCNYVERLLLKEAGGMQDAYYPACGGFISIHIDRAGEICVRPIPVCDSFINEFERSLVLVYTGTARDSFQIAASHDNPDCDAHKLEILRLSKQLYDELCKERIVETGEILHECWINKQKLSKDISNSDIDQIYKRALELGAYGGKLMGAGKGGLMLFLISPELRQKFIENIGHYCITPKIDWEGTTFL